MKLKHTVIQLLFTNLLPVTDQCLYQGKLYTTGQSWDDGCTYTCVCVDGMSGQYRCTEK